jgi:alanine racemase
MIPSSFNRVVIELDALTHNFNLLKRQAGKAEFLAMVKADGYGHGMIECACALQKCGCNTFGAAELREAVLLRQAGINGAIYSMVGFDEENADLFCDYDVIPVVYNVFSLQALSTAAVKNKKDIAVHVKVDCGMSRLGIRVEQVDEFVSTIKKLPGLKLGGIASHFPTSDDTGSSVTAECFNVFKSAQKSVGKTSPLITHIANSGAALYFPETHCDMVRCGIALYGYYPDGGEGKGEDELRPVMSYTTRVLQVKDIPPGTGVSYGHTYITNRQTRLAVLPVGYEDGFSRQLTNQGEVLIRGRRAPIRGRVCMNLCMVDVTDIEGAAAGDEVVLLGKQGKDRITADEIASHIGTISYEVLCMIGNNNEREFI